MTSSNQPSVYKLLPIISTAQSLCLGLIVSVMPVYFTRFVGLSISEFGVGLSLASFASVFIAYAVGFLNDRVSIRGNFATILFIESIAAFLLTQLSSLLSFILIMFIYQSMDSSSSATRNGFIAKYFGQSEQVSVRSSLRVANNIGFSIGAMISGVAYYSGTKVFFTGIFLFSSLLYLIAFGLVLKLPYIEPQSQNNHINFFSSIRNSRFFLFILLNSIICISFPILEVGVPLLIADHNNVSEWFISFMFLLNTIMVVFFQKKIGRFSEKIKDRNAIVSAGILLLISCILLGYSGIFTGYIFMGLFVIIGINHALGEIFQISSAWSISYRLSPKEGYGQYQGLYGISTSIGISIGTLIVTSLVLPAGLSGWTILGMLMLIASILISFLVKSTEF
ncbi:MFS transporter [Vibrio mediterranei]|uniref:MFS transporter n=2 Tax=Vibrio mediterranei TaxID=689 RepID=UPI00148D94F9|nr:MFS transporter [Vibrio mediterranei]